MELAKFAQKLRADLASHDQQRGTKTTAAGNASLPSTATQSFSDPNSHSEGPIAFSWASKRTANISEVTSNSATKSGKYFNNRSTPRKGLRSDIGALQVDIDANNASEVGHTEGFGQDDPQSDSAIGSNEGGAHPGIVFRLSVPEIASRDMQPSKLQWYPDMQQHQFLSSVCELFNWGEVSSVTVRLPQPEGQVEERTIEEGQTGVGAREWVRSYLVVLHAQPTKNIVEIDTHAHTDGLRRGLSERVRREQSELREMLKKTQGGASPAARTGD